MMDCARTVRRGLERAQADGVDLTQWRSAITHMLGRLGDLGGLRDFAHEQGIELSDGDVRLAEMAVFKKAYRLIKEGDYQSKLLPCALRVGPQVDGASRVWHLEEMTGADVITTCPPPFWEGVLFLPNPENIEYTPNRIEADIPKRVLDKLMRVPYFERAFAEDGYTRDEYNSHPGLVKTADEFSNATGEMVEFAGSCLSVASRR
jgi:transaldolase